MSDKTIKLEYMVDPDEIKKRCYVQDPIKIRIFDSMSPLLEGILGESGRKMADAGLTFIFTRSLARVLIQGRVAAEVEDLEKLDITSAKKAQKRAVQLRKKFNDFNNQNPGTLDRSQIGAMAWEQAAALEISLQSPAAIDRFEWNDEFRKDILNRLTLVESILQSL